MFRVLLIIIGTLSCAHAQDISCTAQDTPLIGPDGTPLLLTQSMLESVMGPTCSIDILSNPEKRTTWLAEAEQAIESKICSAEEAFLQVLANNAEKISQAFIRLPKLIKPKKYDKLPNILNPKAPVSPLQKLFTLIVICNEADQPADANIPNLHNFPKRFRKSSLLGALAVIDYVEKYTSFKTCILLDTNPFFSMLAWAYGLKTRRLIIPVAKQMNGCRQWTAHGKFNGAEKFIFQHDVISHLWMVLLAEKAEQHLYRTCANNERLALQTRTECFWDDLEHRPTDLAQKIAWGKSIIPFLAPVWNTATHFYHTHEVPIPSMQKYCGIHVSINDDDHLYNVIKALLGYKNIDEAKASFHIDDYAAPSISDIAMQHHTRESHRHWNTANDTPHVTNFVSTLQLIYHAIAGKHQPAWGPPPTEPDWPEVERLFANYSVHCILTDWPLCAPVACGHSTKRAVCLTPTRQAITSIKSRFDYWMAASALEQTIHEMCVAIPDKHVVFFSFPIRFIFNVQKQLYCLWFKK